MTLVAAARRVGWLPVPGWVRGYRRSWLRGDVIAGVTVTAFLVPQVMAYADLGVALAMAVALLCVLGWFGHLSVLAQLGKLVGISTQETGSSPSCASWRRCSTGPIFRPWPSASARSR
jgi:hypothetical protein